MQEEIATLRTHLETLLKLLHGRPPLPPGSWQANALITVQENVTRYLMGLDGLPFQHEDAVCRVSGIRKGISDLGIFSRIEDEGLMQLVVKIDDLATSLCARQRAEGPLS